ncbi:acyl-CoA dehydrogenase [Halostella sp. JP-L12]|uniref:acyl-CoA dehydrogenase family protein n=1 Tax=Halostella TaxID=1843185 RepID=UPI000EF7F85D|nr:MULTISPECIES: acyl-CoA dehydrogenase family protein [Halostella]NHN46203.1 acyl-CoA dehydrogenase [Halostella sp. JP-L12]
MEDAFDYADHEEGRHVNYWALDPALRRELERVYAADEFEWARPRLEEFGEVVGGTVADNADYVDDHGPELDTYDKHGDAANRVRYPAEHVENERLVYESGIVADAFRAPPGRAEPMPFSHYLGMLYLLSYADPGLACPVAMTAGAALVLEKYDDGDLAAYYDSLTARDHGDLIEGAMFLTEKQGGSDVGATETTATYDDETECFRLDGEKWFCSNIDAEGTLALARTPDAPDGTAGLSMFLVPHTTTDGELNDQLYRRLKDKLGTISVPTGEVEFRGAEAYLVGEEEAGFRQMADMLNLERLSNAAASCGIMGRCLLESAIHAANREAFGNPIQEYPLMREDLVDMTVDHEAATAFVFEAARLFSARERAERAGEDADEAYRLMRALIPIAKLRTGRMAVDTASYAMEVQGGNGYVNDFVTNRLLRDAQVLPIWEGTENVLSLDLLRALDREDAHEPLLDAIQSRLDDVSHPGLADAAATVEAEYHDLATALATLAGEDEEYAQLSAKRLAHYTFEVFAAALLLSEAQAGIDDGDGRTALVARRFVDTHLADREARGIAGGDRTPVERFDAIVRHAPVDPDAVSEAAPADD